MKQLEFSEIVKEYKSKIKPEHRYSSFDYCYNYFHDTKQEDLIENLEKSCLILGFYLASWGMFRGSSFLLQKSVKHFQPTIEFLSELDEEYWIIDVDQYTPENINKIVRIYNEIEKRIIPNNNASLTLITKILLGVFGFIPAYDSFFCTTFRNIYQGACGFRKVNQESLTYIKTFYDINKKAIDNLSQKTFTINFNDGNKTSYNYPKAKIIDMFGFMRGKTLIQK